MKNTERYFNNVAGFIEDMKEAAATYDRAVQRLEPFKGSVAYEQGMQTARAEQAALLNVLQMRKSVSRDELDRAARQLEGCPTALAVLADLAQAHKITGFRYEHEWSTEDAFDKIDVLEGSARKLLQAGLAAADRRVPEDVTYCLYYSVPREGADTSDGVRSGDLVPDKKTIAAFCNAVDG